MRRPPSRNLCSPHWRRRFESIVRSAVRAEVLQTMTPPRSSAPLRMTNRDRIREQRLQLCVPLRLQGKTWSEIYEMYRRQINEAPGALPDPKAGSDVLRQMCERYRPELRA